MSTELKLAEYKYSQRGLAEGIRSRYDSKCLAPNVVYEIPPLTNAGQEIARYGAVHDGENQRLRALIKTPKDEYYAIVDMTTIDRIDGKVSGISEATALTIHIPNQKAELVGYLEDYKQITISHTQDKISKDDFSILRSDNGVIGIVSYKDKDQTEIFTPSNITYGMPERLLHMDTVDPTENPDFWSFETTDKIDMSN